VARIKRFLNDAQAQDVVEYTLLVAFVVLVSAGLFMGNGGSVQGIWGTADSQLALANSGVSPGSAGTPSDPASRQGNHGGHGGGGHGGDGHGGYPGGGGHRGWF